MIDVYKLVWSVLDLILIKNSLHLWSLKAETKMRGEVLFLDVTKYSGASVGNPVLCESTLWPVCLCGQVNYDGELHKHPQLEADLAAVRDLYGHHAVSLR